MKNQEIEELRIKLSVAATAAKNANDHVTVLQRRIEDGERRCSHDFGKIIDDHVYHKAYTIPGDKPGTMGVDFRGPCYVEAKTDKCWIKTCKICGLVKRTTRTKTTEEPDF